jgi:UDP-GlcNAc:undecaprenyl-phosphate/decaprenyl-phosphate GlcNAc-1-phosphate transferase
MEAMLGLCLSLIGLGLLISVPTCALLIRVSLRRGWVDKPDAPAPAPAPAPGSAPADTRADSPAALPGRKQHGRSVPNTGGLALLASIVGPMIAGLTFIHFAPPSWFTSDHLPAMLRGLAVHLDGLHAQTPMALKVIAAGMLIHVMGIIDDRRPLGPFVKLGIELALTAAIVLFADIRALQAFDHYGPLGTGASNLLSVLWIVAITNAMNFLDNMDGLSAGVGAVIAALYFSATLLNGQWFVAAASALLLGGLLGFLVFNVSPARLFMGDGGSLLLGFLLAVISIRTTYFRGNWNPAPGHERAWFGVLTPLVVMAVPLYDLTAVTLLRLARGRSPFQADRNHFSHRLVRLGLTPRAAVGVIWLATLATGLGGVMLSRLAAWQAVLVAAQTLATLAVLALLEWAGHRRP